MENVSVIIPTYNREHTLRIVIGSYLKQVPVKEIVFVVDGSTDGTARYLRSIKSETAEIKVIENSRRKGAQYCKNRGISESSYDYVFIGEDDVILSSRCIEQLLEVMKSESADVAGCRVLYMSGNETLSDTLARYNRQKGYPIDYERLDIQFGKCYDKVIEVPFVQGISLIKREVFEKIKYDTGFRGSAYREETDFYLRCKRAGKRILWCPYSVSYNLPHELCKNGGQRAISPLIYEASAVINNLKFLLRHYAFLKKEYNIRTPLIKQQMIFTGQRFKRVTASIKRRLKTLAT